MGTPNKHNLQGSSKSYKKLEWSAPPLPQKSTSSILWWKLVDLNQSLCLEDGFVQGFVKGKESKREVKDKISVFTPSCPFLP